MQAGQIEPRGQGLLSLASRCFWPLLAALAALSLGCDDAASKADNTVRRMAGNTGLGCTLLPDTSAARGLAQRDYNDLPVTQLLLPEACATITVEFRGGPYIERTYKVVVPAAHTLVARAHGDSASVVIAVDYPTDPKPDRSNVARLVTDSLRVDARREVSVRVRLVPKLREEPPSSRVFLTVLVRP